MNDSNARPQVTVLGELIERADCLDVALSNHPDTALSNHPDTGCPPVCALGAAVADDVRWLVAEIRALRVKVIELCADEERLANYAEGDEFTIAYVSVPRLRSALGELR